MGDFSDAFAEIVKARKEQEKENIIKGIPIILQLDEELSVDDICSFLGSLKKKQMIKQLFNILEYELQNLNHNSDLTRINNIISYIEKFSEDFNKTGNIGKVYMYSRASTILNINDATKKRFKGDSEIEQLLSKIAFKFDTIKSESLKKHQYRFIMQFIHEIKDLKDIRKLIAKNPHLVNLSDKHNNPILYNLIDTFLKIVQNKNVNKQTYNLTYYQSLVELFLSNEYLVIDPSWKRKIEDRLNEATRRMEKENEPQKLLWIKSMHNMIFDKEKSLSGDEVLSKYGINVHLHHKESSKYKLSSSGRLLINDPRIITIDQAYSKDLDDAISLEKKGGIYHLKCYIADIASLISRGSSLDLAAKHQVETFYLPDRIKPLFPTIITEDLGSLNVGSLKNAICFDIVINQNGQLEMNLDILKASIMVNRRFSFDEVNNILVNGDSNIEMTRMLHHMAELSTILKSKSKRLNLSLLNEVGGGIDLPNNNSNAHNIIEEFMLLVGTTVATKLNELGYPCIYRTHKFDRKDELERAKSLITDVYSEKNEVLVNDILRVLSGIMDNARYSSINTGHEALDKEAYGQFTAPIRRYGDLEHQRVLYDFHFSEPTLEKLQFYDKHFGTLIPHLNRSSFVNATAISEYAHSKRLGSPYN